MSAASLAALVDRQLAIGARQDPHHCSICDRHLGMWYFGFPFPYCCFCVDRIRLGSRLCCPPRAKEPCREPGCEVRETWAEYDARRRAAEEGRS